MAYPKNRNQIFFIISLFLILVAFSFPGEASVRVEPSRFIFHIAPGARETGAITVTNYSDVPITLNAVIYDWDLDEDNDLIEYELGTLKETMDGLIRFNPRQFTLEPGQTQIVRFTINFPVDEGEPFERRGVIFFEHEDDIIDEEGFGAVLKTMVGTTIYARPAEFRFNFVMIEGLVIGVPSGQRVAALLLGNPSFVHARFIIAYRVLNSDGEIVEEGTIPETVILPEKARPVYFPLEKQFPSGEYRLILNFDFPEVNFKLSENILFQVGN